MGIKEKIEEKLHAYIDEELKSFCHGIDGRSFFSFEIEIEIVVKKEEVEYLTDAYYEIYDNEEVKKCDTLEEAMLLWDGSCYPVVKCSIKGRRYGDRKEEFKKYFEIDISML